MTVVLNCQPHMVHINGISHKIGEIRMHDFTQNSLRNIRPLVALFTYSRESLVVPQHYHMSFIDNTIL